MENNLVLTVLFEQETLKNLKKYIRNKLPDISSGHADEAIAAGLGFSQSAALKSLLKNHKIPFAIPFNFDSFNQKMETLGNEGTPRFQSYGRFDEELNLVFDHLYVDSSVEREYEERIKCKTISVMFTPGQLLNPVKATAVSQIIKEELLLISENPEELWDFVVEPDGFDPKKTDAEILEQMKEESKKLKSDYCYLIITVDYCNQEIQTMILPMNQMIRSPIS